LFCGTRKRNDGIAAVHDHAVFIMKYGFQPDLPGDDFSLSSAAERAVALHAYLAPKAHPVQRGKEIVPHVAPAFRRGRSRRFRPVHIRLELRCTGSLFHNIELRSAIWCKKMLNKPQYYEKRFIYGLLASSKVNKE
jgi:hypothetical protein